MLSDRELVERWIRVLAVHLDENMSDADRRALMGTVNPPEKVELLASRPSSPEALRAAQLVADTMAETMARQAEAHMSVDAYLIEWLADELGVRPLEVVQQLGLAVQRDLPPGEGGQDVSGP